MVNIAKIGTFIRVWSLRLLPVLGFAVLGGFLSIQIDRYLVEQKAGEEFLNYTSFVASNAREGENVNFTLCREHDRNYNVTGNLNIYVVRSDNNTPYQVYARDVKDQVSNECDNKEIQASDFHHEPGTYEMRFCVDFKVKYDIQKTVCKSSNRYKIYEQPTDIQAQIKKTEELLSELRGRQSDSVAGRDTSGQQEDLSPVAQVESRPTANPAPPKQETVSQAPNRACLIENNLLGLIKLNIACESR